MVKKIIKAKEVYALQERINRVKEEYTLKRGIRQHFHEVMKEHTSPHSIAMGFAIGTLINTLPTPGFNILLGVIAILLYKTINKISVFRAMAILTPFTPLVYVLSYRIGSYLFGSFPEMEYSLGIIGQLFNLTGRFLAGNVILAVSLSVLSYFAVRKIAQVYQGKKSAEYKKDSHTKTNSGS